MRIITKSLTEACHKLGDLLYEVREGNIVELRNSNTKEVKAYLISPSLFDFIDERFGLTDEEGL